MHHLTSNLHYFHYEKVCENYKEFLEIDFSSDLEIINDLKK